MRYEMMFPYQLGTGRLRTGRTGPGKKDLTTVWSDVSW